MAAGKNESARTGQSAFPGGGILRLYEAFVRSQAFERCCEMSALFQGLSRSDTSWTIVGTWRSFCDCEARARGDVLREAIIAGGAV